MKPKPATTPAAADILAPITVTVTGRLAAALRWAAVLSGEAPEEAAADMIRAGVQCSIEDIEPFFGGADFETWCKKGRSK